jgi:hypothetical protein
MWESATAITSQVRELNQMLKAWDEIRQSQDAQITMLISRGASGACKSPLGQ